MNIREISWGWWYSPSMSRRKLALPINNMTSVINNINRIKEKLKRKSLSNKGPARYYFTAPI
jgi:hypothetical protein